MKKPIKESQKEEILNELTLGYRLTPLDAFKLCGTFKLSTRCSELAKSGWPIRKEAVTVSTKRGSVRVMSYYLPQFQR